MSLNYSQTVVLESLRMRQTADMQALERDTDLPAASIRRTIQELRRLNYPIHADNAPGYWVFRYYE